MHDRLAFRWALLGRHWDPPLVLQVHRCNEGLGPGFWGFSTSSRTMTGTSASSTSATPVMLNELFHAWGKTPFSTTFDLTPREHRPSRSTGSLRSPLVITNIPHILTTTKRARKLTPGITRTSSGSHSFYQACLLPISQNATSDSTSLQIESIHARRLLQRLRSLTPLPTTSRDLPPRYRRSMNTSLFGKATPYTPALPIPFVVRRLRDGEERRGLSHGCVALHSWDNRSSGFDQKKPAIDAQEIEIFLISYISKFVT